MIRMVWVRTRLSFTVDLGTEPARTRIDAICIYFPP